ncbi:hypothetical protein [Vibrio cyclitrophicus]|uniref:hypothetical protein n=1 Tax=Vibrio cyclitrophicus TaxID=47951 RepID=UPI000C83F6CE|nr:hypothetical protein [Vibrio cyclitrophicus]PMF43170.1 hypothetical protein BCV14_19970 [Vibrio cyclitrophicus]
MSVKHVYKGVRGVVPIAKSVGICPSTIFLRMKNGMTLTEAVETPVQRGGVRVSKNKPTCMKKPSNMNSVWASALGMQL